MVLPTAELLIFKWKSIKNIRSMIKNELVKFLREVPLFSELTREESDDLLEVVEEISLPAKRIIFQEGDKGDSLFIIKSGRIKISKKYLKGEEKTLALLGPKSIFGEMALLEDSGRSASATAEDDVKLLELSRKDLDGLAEMNPFAGFKIMFGIARVLSFRLRKMDEEFVNIFSHPFRSIKELEVLLEKVKQNFISIGWEKQ